MTAQGRSALALVRVGAVALAMVGGLAGWSGAAAQGETTATAGTGVTVIGYGEASAPAESATMQIVISEEDYGPARPPRRGAEPGAEERRLVEPIVAELITAGVPKADIDVLVNPTLGEYFGPSRGLARLDFEVPEPTAAGVRNLVDAAIVAAAGQGLVVGQVGVGYGVADCRAVERDARAAALEDAAARAEIQAELLGVELGAPTASVDQQLGQQFDLYYGAFGGGSASGCAPPGPAVTGAAISVAPYDPAGEAVVDVYAQVAVTYAIAEAAS